jgi:hypothetical protein
MFKKHSFQVKMVKDDPKNEDPTLLDQIKTMSPEELEELNRKLMRQMAINIGGVIVAKVAVTIILSAIAKKLLEPKE